MEHSTNAQGVSQVNPMNQTNQSELTNLTNPSSQAAPTNLTNPEKQTVPIRCEGVAVILLKKYLDEYFVLMLKRAGRMLHGEWCYIGGGIEQGEKAWEAALREIYEETGITNVRLYTTNQFEQFYSQAEDYIYMAPVFVGYVHEDQSVQLNHEHSDYRWMTFDEAKQNAALPGIDDILDFVEKHFAKNTPSKWLKMNIANE